MRLFVVASAVVAVGVLVATLARLGGTLAQVRALDLPAVAAALPQQAASAPVVFEPAAPAVPLAARAASAEFGGEGAPAGVASGDEHILRALTSDAEFQRAAAELLLEPDPAVQAEARQLLRELGAAQSE